MDFNLFFFVLFFGCKTVLAKTPTALIKGVVLGGGRCEKCQKGFEKTAQTLKGPGVFSGLLPTGVKSCVTGSLRTPHARRIPTPEFTLRRDRQTVYSSRPTLRAVFMSRARLRILSH